MSAVGSDPLLVGSMRARLTARLTSAGVRVHAVSPEDDATVPQYPYCVLYLDAGVRDSDRESHDPTRAEFTAQTTCVGVSTEQAEALVGRVAATLTTARLDSRPVRHLATQVTRRDDDLPDRTVYYSTSQWALSPLR